MVVARRGSVVHGKIVQAKQSGRVSGVAEMSIEIERINTVGGEQPVVTEAVKKEAPSTKGKDAAKVGILSSIGAAIGAVAGGRKGAGIGAGAGAAGGVADVMIERGKPVKLNPEDRVTFRLRAPLTVNADGSKLQNAGPSDPERPTLHRRNS